VPEQHNFKNTIYTKKTTFSGGFMDSGMSSNYYTRKLQNVTSCGVCKWIDRKSIGFVAPKDTATTVGPLLSQYLKTRGMRLITFTDLDEFLLDVKSNLT